MGHRVVGLAFVFLGNSDVYHDSVEGLFSMWLLPRKHSSDNPPDVIVRPSRMSWGLFLVAECSRFQFCLGSCNDSGLCPRYDSLFSIEYNHLLSFEGLLRNVACHSSKNQVRRVNNLFFRREIRNYFFQLSVIPPSPSLKPADFALIMRAASRTIFSGGIVPVDSTRNVKVLAFSS